MLSLILTRRFDNGTFQLLSLRASLLLKWWRWRELQSQKPPIDHHNVYTHPSIYIPLFIKVYYLSVITATEIATGQNMNGITQTLMRDIRASSLTAVSG